MDLDFHTTVIILNVSYLFLCCFVFMPSLLIVCITENENDTSPASRGLQEHECQTTEEGQH